ncbi:tyrosine-type recombinase/integrase [Ectobacillus antri]|uniref:tyrosine-type recombinase/integrase n=1 Tax=Ectobacillus antri TaxID=2486280 RepID=UPI000F59A159|nr:tyrosine-type recombinase/integrase [Ectobacillus antri]
MASFRKYKKGGKDAWSYRIRYKDPFTGEFKEKTKRGFTSKKEASLAAAEEELKLANKDEVENVPVSLEHFLYDWLSLYKKSNVRKNTFQLHQRNIATHILPHFKKVMLKDIKPIMYQKFIHKLAAKGYSKRTIEIIHSTMNNAMKKAIQLNKLKSNPCEHVVIPNVSKNTEELKYMRTEDIPRFLQAAYQYNYVYYIFFKGLLNTGMRKGEAAALQWKDIDLKEQQIHINKTLDFSAKTREDLFGDTKTFTSKRTISIPKSFTDDLLKHKRWQNENKLALQDLYKHDLDLVFAKADGDFLPKSTLFNAFSRILVRAELPHLDIHSLRHTHAVLLMESGANMKYIQTRLGHKDMQTTANIYSHISKKINQDSINQFDYYMSNVLEQ